MNNTEMKKKHNHWQVTSFCAMHISFVRLLFVNYKNFMRANFNLIFFSSCSALFFAARGPRNMPSSGF